MISSSSSFSSFFETQLLPQFGVTTPLTTT
jgi:hypothetical protein